MSIYKELLPEMGGYITHAVDLDRGRLEQLLSRVGALELEVLEERAAVCVCVFLCVCGRWGGKMEQLLLWLGVLELEVLEMRALAFVWICM